MMKFNINKMVTAAALSLILSASAAMAQNSEALPFVRIDRDPASAGMGFAGTASASNITYSSFRNSSVIPFSTKDAAIGASFQSWAPVGVKTSNINFGAALKAGERLGFSVGAAYQIGQAYDIIDASGKTSGSFTPGDLVINAGMGFKIIDNLAVGANVRYASESLSDDDSYSAIAADLFATYRLSDLNISAGVSSIGSSVKASDGTSFSLPASATVALDYTKTFAEKHGIEAAIDADYFFSGNFTAALGAQYSFNDMVFLRAGYHLGSDSAVLPSFITAGAGVKFFGISLDAAYLTGNEVIGNTITLGLGYSF